MITFLLVAILFVLLMGFASFRKGLLPCAATWAIITSSTSAGIGS
jgi:hypothetical protein